MSSLRSLSRSAWMVVLTGAVIVGGVLGCGYETYELRLKQSKDYFAYLERVEANLAPVWSDQHGIIKVRVPKQFVSIPAPQPIKREDGTLEMPAVDPRQPDYLNLILPELTGAWEAPVEVTLPDGNRETRKAYIYAMSNYWQFIGENPSETPNFTRSAVELIGLSLEQTLPDEKKTAPETEMHPKPGTYVPSASYNVYRYQPKAITQQTEDRRSSVNYTFEIYERQNGDVQVPIVVVLPEGIDPREKINERIPMMLESVVLTGTPPRPDAQKNAPASTGPAGGGF